MNVLFLLSEEDRTKVSSTILVENVTMRSDPEIQTELLLSDYDTCFITSNYTKIYGSLVTTNIMKTFQKFTRTRIHYLIEEDYEMNTDEVIPAMAEMGLGNVTLVDWDNLGLEEFRKLSRMDRTVNLGSLQRKQVSLERLELLKDELTRITDSEMETYIKQNKGKILDLIQGYIGTLVKNEKDSLKIQTLVNENQYLNKIKLQSAGEIHSLESKLEMNKRDLKELRASVVEYKDRIDDYNYQILDNGVINYPIVYLDDLSPTIVYFKEIEDIGFYNMFESLFYTLTEVYKTYTKSIILERSNRHFFNPYARDGYSMVTKDSPLNVIINNDKLIRYGNPTDLLKRLSSPEFRTEVILIYDRLGTEDITVDAPYLMPYYLGNYRDTYVTLDISDVSFISPFEGEWKGVAGLLNHKNMNKDEKLIFNAFASKHSLTEYIMNSLIEPLPEEY